MTINVRADLFRIAAMFQSDEDTRYYLCGVYVEPHANGVTLTATNGHYLLSVHDETGSCSQAAIIQLSADTLRACKPNRKDVDPRRVTADPDGKAFVVSGETQLAVSTKAYVDGTFPDWRLVVRQADNAEPSKHDPKASAFDQAVLRPFLDAARELSTENKRLLTMTHKTTGGPMIVSFPDAPHAFGLAMPCHVDQSFTPGVPAWVTQTRIANAA